MTMDHREALARRFRSFTPTFLAGGSPLYARLALDAARAMHDDEPFCLVLDGYLREPERLLLPLRLFAAVHRWVLRGRLEELAAYYPSMGGVQPPDHVWPLFRDAVVRFADELPVELAGVNQHNEVGRAAALSLAFQELASRYPMPVRLLEVGASAGLLLLWDQYLGQPWYPRMFTNEADVPREAAPAIVARKGCDLNPVDPRTPDGALRLQSFVWADLVEHLRMLDAATAISRRVPASIELADAGDWLASELAVPTPGVLTVVYHSMMVAASPSDSLHAMGIVIEEAAARATTATPLAYVRLEAAAERPGPARCELIVCTWPDDDEHVLATCDVNGRHIVRTGGFHDWSTTATAG